MYFFAPIRTTQACLILVTVVTIFFSNWNSPVLAQSEFEFKASDHVCIIGNTLADRMQHYPWLETYLTLANPDKKISFRNLGFAADEIKTRPRSANFGSPDQWLAKCNATVIFCFFGYNEALRGESGLPQFESDLADSIDQMLAQRYNNQIAPRLAFFSPIAHNNLNSPHLPDGSANNANLRRYTDSMRRI